MATDPNHMEGHPNSSSIIESLQMILRSSQFKNAVQLQSLLKYVVERSIEGQEGALKERIIGMSVFGRRADYDTASDPIVRSRMGLLRKRLAHYYQSRESQGSAIEIIISNGSYRPTFVLRNSSKYDANLEGPAESRTDPATAHSAEEHLEPDGIALSALHDSRLARVARWWPWGIVAVVTWAMLFTAWMGIAHRKKSDLQLFWGPILASEKPVVIYYGTFSAFMLSDSYWKRTAPPPPATDLEQPGSDIETPQLGDDQALTGRDFRHLPDGFTTPGDLSATANVAALIESQHRKYNLRSGANFPFADLHGTPAVLIGAYSNFWTMDLTRNLWFYFDRGGRIRERGGQGRFWSNPSGPDTAVNEDYAIISRLLDSKTGSPVVIIAGTRTCGTDAAGIYITDPARLQGIPRDVLERKNLELVLHVSLVDCSPTSIEVVAAHYW